MWNIQTGGSQGILDHRNPSPSWQLKENPFAADEVHSIVSSTSPSLHHGCFSVPEPGLETMTCGPWSLEFHPTDQVARLLLLAPPPLHSLAVAWKTNLSHAGKDSLQYYQQIQLKQLVNSW